MVLRKKENNDMVPLKDIVDIAPSVAKGVIKEEQREGIFEHNYKCLKCGLEFKLYSWLEFRHDATNVFCPECGQRGEMLHHQKTINTRKTFDLCAGDEIFNLMKF